VGVGVALLEEAYHCGGETLAKHGALENSNPTLVDTSTSSNEATPLNPSNP